MTPPELCSPVGKVEGGAAKRLSHSDQPPTEKWALLSKGTGFLCSNSDFLLFAVDRARVLGLDHKAALIRTGVTQNRDGMFMFVGKCSAVWQ